jgi:Trk K+ transport system NAD-binding subunit
MKRTRRFGIAPFARYAFTIARNFRWTLGLLALALAVGTIAFRSALPDAPLDTCAYGAWMALFAQPIVSPPPSAWTELTCALYPLLGFVLIGDGIVRLSLLVLSRQHGEKDWMKVMASTYRDHVVLCGLGHLGYRILGELIAARVQVVAIEKDPQGKFLAQAKATGVPILVRDMKDDEALVEAGVASARCVILATNDDIANLEVALDSRRFNPKVKILMRMFDQSIADKVKDAFAIDQAFSSAALAAPIVAAMSHRGQVLATYPIGGVAHLSAELEVERGSPLDGKSVSEVESAYGARVLSHRSGAAAAAIPGAAQRLAAGDTIVVHAPSDRVAALLAAPR